MILFTRTPFKRSRSDGLLTIAANLVAFTVFHCYVTGLRLWISGPIMSESGPLPQEKPGPHSLHTGYYILVTIDKDLRSMELLAKGPAHGVMP